VEELRKRYIIIYSAISIKMGPLPERSDLKKRKLGLNRVQTFKICDDVEPKSSI
jgi:hypothetical protein